MYVLYKVWVFVYHSNHLFIKLIKIMSDQPIQNNVHKKLGHYESNSSMPLQLLLFFNVLLFPLWFVINGLFLYLKFSCLGKLTKFLSIAVFVMITSIEIVRLYLGYLGNLSERIPELAGFWMLSILLQLPLESFQLGNPYLYAEPIQFVINGFKWALLIAQLIFGVIALRLAARRAKEYFSFKSFLRNQAENNKNFTKTKTD